MTDKNTYKTSVSNEDKKNIDGVIGEQEKIILK
jgi:hypothetical protein